MKIRMEAETLRGELSRVVSVMDKGTKKPNLEFVLVEPVGENVKFTGSDGVAAIESFAIRESRIEFEDAAGPFCLPGRKTLDLVKLMEGEVRLETLPNGYINLYNGRSKYRLGSIDASRYPRIADQFGDPVTLPGQILKRAIKLTRGFIGEDDSKFAFSGGLLECGMRNSECGILRVVATDGARLALAEYESERVGGEEFSVLIPHRSLNVLANLIKDEGEVKVAFARNALGVSKVKFRVGRAFLTTNLTIGTFPAWRQIVPTGAAVRAEVNRTEMFNALRKALVATDFKSNIVEINFAPDSVVVKTDGVDTGSDVLDAEYLTGEPAEERLGLNANFVNQFLAAVPDVLEEDRVVLSYNGPAQFVGISPREAEFDFKYLLAPARL